MPTVTSSGLGSGIDIRSLVEQLVAAERAPVANRLTTREASANTELSALGRFRSALATFRDAVARLKSAETFDRRKVTVENDKVFTGTATTAAVPGSYAIEVQSLASAERLRSGPFADASGPVGSGILSITVGGATTSLAIDEAAGSLADIRNAINNDPQNPGIRATIITAADGARLVLTASATGAANGITVSVSGGNGGLASLAFDPSEPTSPMVRLQAAADAVITIDGITVTSAGNALGDAIEGVTVQLVSAEPGTEYTLTVDTDRGAARTAVQGFVAAYNSFIDTVTELTRFNVDTREAAPLLGDATVRGVRDQLRRELSSLPSAGSFGSLAALGVTTETSGRLAIDATRLDAALDNDLAGLGVLFAGTAGLATRLEQVASSTLASGSTIAAREASLKTTLKGITSQRQTLDDRIGQVRSRLLDQFNAMDRLVAQLRTTSDFLSQRLSRNT